MDFFPVICQKQIYLFVIVLVLVEMELTFFVAASRVLSFVFVAKPELRTPIFYLVAQHQGSL